MGDFERAFGRTSDEPVDRTGEHDDERAPTPIPAMPDGMSTIEEQLFRDLREAADNMADLLGVDRAYLLSDWNIFQVVASMPTTEEEIERIPHVGSANCSSDFIFLVKKAIVDREKAEAAFWADQKAREEKQAARVREVQAATAARKLDEWVAAGNFPAHGKLVTGSRTQSETDD